MYGREKRNEKVCSRDTGRSDVTNPRRGKPTCAEPGVWDQPVGDSVLAEGTSPSQDERAQTGKTLAEYKVENKRLRMENELLRDFLRSTERK